VWILWVRAALVCSTAATVAATLVGALVAVLLLTPRARRHPSFGNYCSVCFKQGKGPTAAAPSAPSLAAPSPGTRATRRRSPRPHYKRLSPPLLLGGVLRGSRCSSCLERRLGSFARSLILTFAGLVACDAAVVTVAATAAAAPSTSVAAATPEAAPTSSVGAVADSSSSAGAAARPVQKNIQKCWQCNKRVGLLGFKCKCDYVFCSNHRLSHAHNCIVDYQTLARGELETRLGDAVVPKKLERL